MFTVYPAEIIETESKPPAESCPPSNSKAAGGGNKANFQNLVTDMTKCFRRIGLESSDEAGRALDTVTEFLTFIKPYRPDNKPRFPPNLKNLDCGGRYRWDVLRINYKFDQIRSKVREFGRKIEKAEKAGEKMHFLDYFAIADCLEQLANLTLDAKTEYRGKNGEIARQAEYTYDCIVKCRADLEFMMNN